ncbi:MAG: aminotransferase class I/II-fold pyridoxal phosphate-dependent enzyme [Phycisphaerales bacterium]|nr:aminotransferase class I/II-fold pyridoxal phosphate-dependent enzyme [Phycisphaerales bacterium]
MSTIPGAPSIPIDLRSDTVTRPTAAMRRVMAEAVVGDDVLGDDPTVTRLQERVAEIMGKEAACFVPSGTMANQASIRAQTEPGDEVIAHEGSHIINYETGAPAALSGVMVRTAAGPRGLFDADQVDGLARPDSDHSPRTRLVVIENTQNRGGGAVWPLDQVRRVSQRARGLGLRVHLDGARLWNACAATGHSPAEFARHADTVSCCFSKGLGAPAGSAVSGDKATIARVFRFRKMFGGAMRQSGILAAAALHALDHHIDRLHEDHENAARLGAGVANIPGLAVPLPVETNMVFIDVDRSIGTAAEFCASLRERGVWMLPTAPQRARAVCHLDVSRAMIDIALAAIESAARAPMLSGAR